MSPKIKLRRFLYLDSKLTDEFLGQVEGGVYEEESHSATGRSERGVNAGVSAGPAQLGGSLGGGEEEERARVMRQTDESSFSRLAGALEENDSVQWLESLDQGIWDQLERGEVLEVECSIEVPPLMKMLVVGAQFEQIGELMKATGQEMDSDSIEGLQTLGAIAGLFQSVPVIASAGDDFKFVAQVNPEFLRVGFDEIDGTARLYGTLDRKLGEGEQYSILDAIPAFRSLPNREEIEANLDEIEEFAGKPITAPAAVVSPIAIFR